MVMLIKEVCYIQPSMQVWTFSHGLSCIDLLDQKVAYYQHQQMHVVEDAINKCM